MGGQARQAAQVLRQSGIADAGAGEGSGQQVAHLTELAAEQVEQFGGYLERASGDQLLRDAEDFARRRPWMVAGFGLVAGLAASRFLKASSERRYGAPALEPARQTRYSYSTRRPAGAARIEPATRARRRLGRVTDDVDDERRAQLRLREQADRRDRERADPRSVAAGSAGARAGQGRDGRERKDRGSRAWKCSAPPALLGLMAAGALTACAVLVLAIFLPAWLSALIVGVVLAGSGVSARQAWQGAGREGRRSDP